MPTTVTMLSLIRDSAEQLLPQELHDFVAKIVANPDDMAIPLVVADWLKEQDEPELEYAFRWMAKHNKKPLSTNYNDQSEFFFECFDGVYDQFFLPSYISPLSAGWLRRINNTIYFATYLAAVAWLAVELDELKKHLQVEGM